MTLFRTTEAHTYAHKLGQVMSQQMHLIGTYWLPKVTLEQQELRVSKETLVLTVPMDPMETKVTRVTQVTLEHKVSKDLLE